ncbi:MULTISPECIES: hypothetical protein [Trichocoleus]|uniref:Uncharacterized protein n=1 Tax=Trichocoleus desertorum GB2-A4 TaxID=2933944 RepID=A0ABV0JCW8_9CYAN|nr:hypothetical protein [Trichocoleus sp. FACHB-46]MBD1863102.1 hypothetical protein [Trichocoleus sp. FACHB-46]
MTPETIRIISNLRQEFYSLFVAEMAVPVKISGSSYNSSSLVASWTDASQYLNYVNIYAYSAPDAFQSERPFILRLAINKGAGDIAVARKGPLCRGLNRKWCFELTILPEEILEFLPWVVSLVEAKAKGSLSSVEEPPYPVTFSDTNSAFTTEAWTQRARQRIDQELCVNH